MPVAQLTGAEQLVAGEEFEPHVDQLALLCLLLQTQPIF